MFIRKRILVLVLTIVFGLGFTTTMMGDDPNLAQSSTLETIIARGEIVVASDLPFEPFEFLDDNGNLVGLDVDLVRLLAKTIFGDASRFRFEATAFDTIIPSLNANSDLDMIVSDITATLSRGLSANFTDPYLNTGQIVAVSTTKSPGSSTSDYNQLNNSGVIIAVQLGTTGEETARTFFPNADIRTFDNAQLALQEVLDGQADAIVFDDVFLGPAAANDSEGFIDLCCPRGNPTPLTQEPIAIAIRKGDPDFLGYLNFFIREAGSNIRVTAELAAEFDLPESTIGLDFLSAIRAKWL
jgi:polar amino acid transport system substrate-binding protein